MAITTDTCKNWKTKLRKILHRYSEWVEENADDLVDVMSNGCTRCSLTLSIESGSYPQIHVDVDRVDKNMLYVFNDVAMEENFETGDADA